MGALVGRKERERGGSHSAIALVGYAGWLCADEESGADLRGGMEAPMRFLREAGGSRE